ncbi:MAG: CDP-diacylglycerol--serine O-phosphatidyltransferase [Bacteroidota bacterium]
MKKHLPNFFTLLNLTLGGLGAIWALQGYLTHAALCLWLGAVCDFLDGLLARLFQTHSPLGVQLDSLADLMTFGWLPASIMYQLIGQYTTSPLPYIALLLPIFAALRLARFNLDNRQQYTFSGLPTPAQGLFISTLPCILAANKYPWLTTWLARPYPLALLVVLLAILMVAPIRLTAFKFTTHGWQPNRLRYTLLLATILLTLLFQAEGLALSLLVYIATAAYTTPKSPKH